MSESAAEIKVEPLILQQKAILKAGKHNGNEYSLEEVRKAFDFFRQPITKRTPVIYRNKNSLVQDHNDGTETFVGDIPLETVTWDDELGGFRGDLRIVDPDMIRKIQFQIDRERESGQPTSFGLSPRLNADTDGNRVRNIKIRNVALVLEPAQGDDMFLSLDESRSASDPENDGIIPISLRDLEEVMMPEPEKKEAASQEQEQPNPTPEPKAFSQEEAVKLLARIEALEAAAKKAESKELEGYPQPYQYRYRKPYGESSAYYPMRGGVKGMSDEEKAEFVKDLKELGKALMAVTVEGLDDAVKLAWEVLGALPGVCMSQDPQEKQQEETLSRKGLSGEDQEHSNLKPMERLDRAIARLAASGL